ncbi:hypothetical protein BRC65_05275 [Halobacteriales archaeon QH_2_65_14]|nr:MAG: hypothetical protein BRC65_05275 [Halobacteriales archaeon QH_2_65_14]
MDGPALRRRLRRDLLAGVAFFLPLALLSIVLYGFGTLLYRAVLWVDDLLGTLGVQGPVATTLAVLTGVVVVPLVLVVTGTVLRHRYGERLAESVDGLLQRIPGVGPIYAELRRSRHVISGEGRAFREVVSLELTDGVDILAFVVGHDSGADWTGGERRVTVYVPLAPNPTVGGHLLAVRDDRLTETNLGVRSALGVVVTVGASDPETVEPPIAGLYPEIETVESTGAMGEVTGEDGDGNATGDGNRGLSSTSGT